MQTAPIAFRSPCILSVTVCPGRMRLAFVVTASPKLVRAVSDYLHESDSELKVIWVTSLETACRRMEKIHADLVVLDEKMLGSLQAMETLHNANPDTTVQLLAGGFTER